MIFKYLWDLNAVVVICLLFSGHRAATQKIQQRPITTTTNNGINTPKPA